MAVLKIKEASDCRWDAVALGEIMLRFDPGDERVHTTRQFRVWEGGGEYNVVRGLRRCFGKRAAVVTAIVDNAVGRLLEDLILQGGVDLRHAKWVPFDGAGRRARNGLNFVERGFGLRAASGTSDRGHTAVSQLEPGDIDWERIFGAEGARWFHCGGIFAALGARTPDVAIEAMRCAKAHGTIVSYDLNYRPSLWESFGGPAKAQAVNREIAALVDVMLGNEEDFSVALGFELEGIDKTLSKLDPANFKRMIREVVKSYPNLRLVGTTLRAVSTATRNDWGAIVYADGEFSVATNREDLEIFDRVGGGDSFASGLIAALLEGKGAAEAVEYGAVHGALAMTTPGDTSMATRKDVERLVAGGGARVVR